MTQSEARKFAVESLVRWKLYQRGWRFQFSNTAKSCGDCNYRKKVIRVSKRWLDISPEEEVKDTILHEIAHALAAYDDEFGHGPLWQMWAVRVGAKPEQFYKGSVRVQHNYEFVDIRTKKRIKNTPVYYRLPGERLTTGILLGGIAFRDGDITAKHVGLRAVQSGSILKPMSPQSQQALARMSESPSIFMYRLKKIAQEVLAGRQNEILLTRNQFGA